MKVITRRINPWPIAIILVFLIFGSATVGLVVFSASQKVDLVSADYYGEELRFQKQIDRVARTQESHADMSVTFDAAKQQIRISMPAEQAQHHASGTVQLYRPSAATLDREFVLEPDQGGTQVLDAKPLLEGLWRIRVFWSVADQDYFHDQDIVVKRSSS